MFNIDSEKVLEKNKMNLPDPYVQYSNEVLSHKTFEELTKSVQKKSQTIAFSEKINKVFWSGAPNSPSTDSDDGDWKKNFRRHQATVYKNGEEKNYPRAKLVKMSDQR